MDRKIKEKLDRYCYEHSCERKYDTSVEEECNIQGLCDDSSGFVLPLDEF